MAVQRASPLYKDFLTPTLHRRFTRAAVIILFLCYLEAILMGEKSSFLWSWFPIGKAGIRTLLLFISALSIFVSRVAQLHLGSRTTPSPSSTFTQSLLSLSTAQTFAWYFFSASWFSEVYMWSASDSADLGWISQGKAWERRKLNERPIYLRSVFCLFAVLQSVLHLYYDYDHIPLPITTAEAEPITPKAKGLVDSISARMQPLLPMFSWDANSITESILRNSITRTVCASFIAPFIYGFLIRRTAWDCSLALATSLWDVSTSRLSFIPPHYPSLVFRSCTSGLLLMFLWESSNVFLTTLVAQEPLKRGQPLSSESKDPCGTLIGGLKSKREVLRTFAFWELLFITQSFDARRKAIFTDIDRSQGAAWNQVMALCLNNIIDINNRIVTSQNPTPANAIPQKQPATIEHLPRISTPLRQENVLSKPPAPNTPLSKIEFNVGAIAKSYGQSPTTGTLELPYTPQAKRFLETSTQRLLLPSSQANIPQSQQDSPCGSTLTPYILKFLHSSFGPPFRHTFSRRLRSVVLGTPRSQLHPIISSVKSLTALAVASIPEDPYGKVSADVPTLIRIYVRTIQSIQTFIEGMPVHWTDVEFKEEDRRVEDVEIVLECMKQGLGEMVEAFGKYAKELGLGREETQVAKRLGGAVGTAEVQ